jgi:hypothetical protein
MSVEKHITRTILVISSKSAKRTLRLCLALALVCAGCELTACSDAVTSYLGKIRQPTPAVARYAFVGGPVFRATEQYHPRTEVEMKQLAAVFADLSGKESQSVRMNCYWAAMHPADDKLVGVFAAETWSRLPDPLVEELCGNAFWVFQNESFYDHMKGEPANVRRDFLLEKKPISVDMADLLSHSRMNSLGT